MARCCSRSAPATTGFWSGERARGMGHNAPPFWSESHHRLVAGDQRWGELLHPSGAIRPRWRLLATPAAASAVLAESQKTREKNGFRTAVAVF